MALHFSFKFRIDERCPQRYTNTDSEIVTTVFKPALFSAIIQVKYAIRQGTVC